MRWRRENGVSLRAYDHFPAQQASTSLKLHTCCMLATWPTYKGALCMDMCTTFAWVAKCLLADIVHRMATFDLRVNCTARMFIFSQPLRPRTYRPLSSGRRPGSPQSVQFMTTLTTLRQSQLGRVMDGKPTWRSHTSNQMSFAHGLFQLSKL
jgi:hypothetical protein